MLPPLPPLPSRPSIGRKFKGSSNEILEWQKANMPKLPKTELSISIDYDKENLDRALNLINSSMVISKDKKLFIEENIKSLVKHYLGMIRIAAILKKEREQAYQQLELIHKNIPVIRTIATQETILAAQEETLAALTTKISELNKKYSLAEEDLDRVFESKIPSTTLNLELVKLRESLKEIIYNKKHITVKVPNEPNISVIQKLLLTAYDLEFDKALMKAEHTSIVDAESTITQLNKRYISLNHMFSEIEINENYHNLRIELIKTVFLQKQRIKLEKEEERLERARLKEEEKVVQETEKFLNELSKQKQDSENKLKEAKEKLTERQQQLLKEKSHYENALAEADPHMAELSARLQELQERLDIINQAISDKKEILSNLRTGYVYVISNVGSFGEGIVKIGLSRRVDPHKRIQELNSASVPFVFDVHTIHFSKDAVALETALHKRFAKKAVNLVNSKKEFFRVTPSEVREAMLELSAGVHLDFKTKVIAEEYWASVRKNHD